MCKWIQYLIVIFLSAAQGYASFNLTWGLPSVSLDSNPPIGDSDFNPKIAIDPFGNAVATWSRTTGAGATEDIWVAVYGHAARIWAGVAKVSGAGSASHSSVALDKQGNAILIWEEGFPGQIRTRSLSRDGVWTPSLELPSELVMESLYAQTTPYIGVDLEGNAIAIWVEIEAGIQHVHSARKKQGLKWENLGTISSGKNFAFLPLLSSIALNESGNGLAAWLEFDNPTGREKIYAAQYVKGAWGQAMQISEESPFAAQYPSVGIDAKGNGIIVWSQGHTIQSRTIIEGILSPLPLLVSNPAFVAKHPCVAVDGAGQAIAVFERYDGGPKDPLSTQYIAEARLPFKGIAWSSPTDISGPQHISASGSGYPILSMNQIGDGVAIWKEYNGKNTVIQGAGFSLGTWSLNRTLSSLERNAGIPTPGYDLGVSVNLAGNVMAVWPEDSSRSNTPQIKSAPGIGLAILGPLPPLFARDEETGAPVSVGGVGTGRQVLHRFPAHGDLINILSWSSPGGVHHYNIYRGNLRTLIGSSETPYFEDHQRAPRQAETYLITSVDHLGQESSPMTIFVRPR